MTLLGKIFTVLIAVMSFVFMAFAVMLFATHTNWKQAALSTDPANPGLKPRLQEQIAVNNRLLQEIDAVKAELAREQAARRRVVETLQTKAATLADDLTKLNDQLRVASAEAQQRREELTRQNLLLKNATDEVQALRTDIISVQKDRDDKLAKVVALSDEINSATRQLNNLKERQTELLTQVAEYRKVSDKLGIRFDAALDAVPPPIDGVVLAADMGRKLIEVSLGVDDGLHVGHTLEVYRGAKYLGKLVVVKAEPNRAVAEIIPEFLKGAIQKGDRVATKLS
jgi:hypothetical protein